MKVGDEVIVINGGYYLRVREGSIGVVTFDNDTDTVAIKFKLMTGPHNENDLRRDYPILRECVIPLSVYNSKLYKALK